MPGALSYPIEKVRGQRHYKIVNFQISDISRRSCGILPWGYRRYSQGAWEISSCPMEPVPPTLEGCTFYPRSLGLCNPYAVSLC